MYRGQLRIGAAVAATLLLTPAMAQAQTDPAQAAIDQANAIRQQAVDQANAARDQAFQGGGNQPSSDPAMDSRRRPEAEDNSNDAAMSSRRRPESEDNNAAPPAWPFSSGHSHSESHSDSSSVSVSVGGGHGRRGGDFRPSDGLLGEWTLGEKGGGWSCVVTLYPDESYGLRRAEARATCMSGFFSVRNWRASGRNLQLTDGNGNAIGSFRQVGPNRFEGYNEAKGTAMFLAR
jgi:hypothetical protein